VKITGLAIIPPAGATDCPRVTPELLASSFARYSRSNSGLESILALIDWKHPDISVEKIFKYVDYGHASIAGLTGGIAMTIDNCSMLLAYKLFELSQLCDGQESSTRYIQMAPSGLPKPAAIGIPDHLAAEWLSVMTDAFALYGDVYAELDRQATENPGIVRLPKGANQKVIDRLRKNYALDRARYFIPLATQTNVGLIMSARAWCQTIQHLVSSPLPEAQTCGDLLRAELGKFTPRLVRHTIKDAASSQQAAREIQFSAQAIKSNGVGLENIPDEVFVSVQRDYPSFLRDIQTLPEAFAGKTNRYSTVGSALKRIFVRFAWNNISIAELRDLNRHRTGHRFSPLIPIGFYTPEEVAHPEQQKLLERHKTLIEKLAADAPGSHYYGYLLGAQTVYEHSTHADKFLYEAELRTGMGTHFRYAEHLRAVYCEFIKQVPEVAPYVQLGAAEPE
jgi:thymidylate synthase ThyX